MTKAKEYKEGLLVSITGAMGTGILVWLTFYGMNKTGENNLWQPMLVPIVIMILLFAVGLLTMWRNRINS